MNIRTLQVIAILGLFVGLFFGGCGPKPLEQQSVLDTPDNHYNQGMRELKRDNLDKAENEFQRAIGLDKDYAGGYVGMGLVLSQKGNYDEAIEWVDKGIGKDDQFIDGYIAKGIIITDGKGKDWLKQAVKQFDKALKINPESEKALFYKGIAYKNAFEFGEAVNTFSQVIALKGDFSAEANAEWELVQKIQRAAPGTDVGKEIALIPEIDRADLAVLFIEELKLLEIFEKKQPKTYNTAFRPPEDSREMKPDQGSDSAFPTDIDGHWAKNWIKDVVKAGAMDMFPDKTFRPDEKITRANYAMFLQNILILVTGDESLATKYIGTPSRYPDVNATHYAYNAICLAMDRGVMSVIVGGSDTLTSGAFEPMAHVSGADALLVIRQFQNTLRMTF